MVYDVLDKTTHFSQGDEKFVVEDGIVEMPAAIAADYVQAGILKLHREEEVKKPMTAAQKKAAAKAAAEAAAEAAEESEAGVG